MDLGRLILKVDRETGEVLEEISPSKVLCWLAVLVAASIATVYLLSLREGEPVFTVDEFLKLEGAAGGFAIVMYSRAGDLVDLLLEAAGSRVGADDG